ncbi:MAG TPA: AgmX/PglI C-terminal domain-containing protein, partial [bacterium]|nr:AgmX/PglI C-terminal domain-containing protein [bacterium]
LVKRSHIWEKSMTDWVRLGEHPDFTEIFQEYDRMAEENVKQVLGTDDETQKKREIKQMMDEVGTEEQNIDVKKESHFKWVIIALVIIAAPVVFFRVYQLFIHKAIENNETEVKVDDINIEDLKFGSGVMKIDDIKGITVKKIAKKEEDLILKELLLEIKKENEAIESEEAAASAEKPKEKKNVGLFDTVTDEELDAFRNSFMKKVGSKSVGSKAKAESSFASGGEELTQKQINEVVKNNYSSIKYCYDKALKSNEGIGGKMEITLHIIGSGKVAKVINETPKFKGTEMDRCITEQIKKKWKFPPFNGTLSTVTIPFLLAAQ